MHKGLDLGQVGTKRLSWLVGALSPVKHKLLDLGQVGTKRLSWLVGALSPVSYIGLEIELVSWCFEPSKAHRVRSGPSTHKEHIYGRV